MISRLMPIPYNHIIEKCFVIIASMITIIYFVFKYIYNEDIIFLTIIISGLLLISTFLPILKKDFPKGHKAVVLSVLIIFVNSLKKQDMYSYFEILYDVLLFLYFMR
jgi:hypothetical protein